MVDKKVIVVTGGAGLVGSHLCEALSKDKTNQVISLDNYFAGSRDNHVDGVEYREGHTKDIAKHIPEKVDLIFHLGEYARVEQSILEPNIVYDLNTLGTKGVIAFWKKQKCKLVYAGSSTKFGDGGKARYTSPYAQTKAENTELVKETGEKEKLPYAITYFYNVYGPRERSGIYGTVVEQFKSMYLSGTPCSLVSPGTQERNFTHVHDIVDALLLVGEKGDGDEFGLGNEKAYSIRALADMFGLEIIMFPERKGNRKTSDLDTSKTTALGWSTKRNLENYVREFVDNSKKGEKKEKRILVFSTTMHPFAGLAEESLKQLALAIPEVHFDVVTTVFSKEKEKIVNPTPNITVHHIGFGFVFDKFLLPFWGMKVAQKLTKDHEYLFTWSLMASYAALAGILSKRFVSKTLLITLADQNLNDLTGLQRAFLSRIMSSSDQVYGTHGDQESDAMKALGKALPRNSLGDGDGFANALRYAYADIVLRDQEKYSK